MSVVRCPKCERKIKVPDDGDCDFVRCPSCRYKLFLDDLEEDDCLVRRGSTKKYSQARPQSFLREHWKV